MKHVTLRAVAAAVLTTTPAHADPQTGGDWTDFYSGGQISRMEVEYPNSTPLFPGNVQFYGTGPGLGVHAGYTHDLGAWVLGAEFSADFPSVDLEQTLIPTALFFDLRPFS